jgi:hypothetical protein
MKQGIVIAAIVGAFVIGHALAQDGGKEAPKNGGGMQMPEWMRKGPEHAELAKTTGEFQVAAEVFMGGDKPAMTMKGESTRKMVKNGYWLREDFKGEWMGQPYEGTLIQGYDRFRKQHVSVWFDSGNTAMEIAHGQIEDGTCTMEGTSPDPHLNKLVAMKSVAVEKDGKMVLERFKVLDGKEQLHMRLTYVKKE